MVLSNRWGYRKSAVLFSHLAAFVANRRLADVVTDPGEQQVIDAAPIVESMPAAYADRLYDPMGGRTQARWVRYSRLVLIRK
jgi:hypothetical protein